jgi:hypothetical protein
MTGRGGELRFRSANSAGPLRRSCEKASAFWKQATCAGRSAASSGSENSPRACPTWARTRSTLVVSGSEICTPRYWRDCSAFGSERGCPPSLRQGTSKTASADHHLRSRHCRKQLPARNLSGAPEAVIDNMAAGVFQISLQISKEAAGIKQILRKYRDRKIDLA